MKTVLFNARKPRLVSPAEESSFKTHLYKANGCVKFRLFKPLQLNLLFLISALFSTQYVLLQRAIIDVPTNSSLNKPGSRRSNATASGGISSR